MKRVRSYELGVRSFLFFVLSVLMLLPAGAQTIGDAFYVYRNDGQFNAFFRDEVLSMEYSYEDADCITYDDVVTQVIETADSTYRIPIAAIDSISFVQPETIVNREVFPLTAEHSPYITDGDIDHFCMDASAPASLQPRKGNIVVATAECDAFADGIMARVTSVSNTGFAVEYTCEPVGFDEVFDQLVYYGEVGEEESAGAKAVGPRKAEGSLTKILWNEPWSKTITYSGTTTKINVSDRASMKVTFRKTSRETPLFLRVELLNSLQSRLDFNAKSEASIAPDPWQIGNTLTIGKITIPIPYTFGMIWLAPKVSLFAYFKEEGKVELDYGCHFNRDDKMIFTYQNGTWNYNYAPQTDLKTDIAQLSMEGSAEVGVVPKVFFSLNGTRAGFGADVQVGVKEYINFLFDATRLNDGGLYAANKDSYCRTTIPYSVKLYANANLFSRYDAKNNDQGAAVISYTFADEKQWGEDKYLLPLFSNLHKVTSNSVKATTTAAAAPAKAAAGTKVVSVDVSRDVLLPTEIGMEVIDEDDNVVATKTAGYSSNSFSDESYTFEFSGLSGGKTYYARPTVGLFSYSISADEKIPLEGETSCPDENHPHAIDLGLPSGTKWACCNVGASSPEQCGGYFAWGETSEKSVYNDVTYKYYSGVDSDGNGWYDSNRSYQDIGNYKDIGGAGYNCKDIAGTSYDVAHEKWGGGWVMPTHEQNLELNYYCSYVWTTENGIYGGRFTGPSGNSVFLPTTAYRENGEMGGGSNYGYYWSSTLYPGGPSYAYCLYVKDGYASWIRDMVRVRGLCVRPVCKN